MKDRSYPEIQNMTRISRDDQNTEMAEVVFVVIKRRQKTDLEISNPTPC